MDVDMTPQTPTPNTRVHTALTIQISSNVTLRPSANLRANRKPGRSAIHESRFVCKFAGTRRLSIRAFHVVSGSLFNSLYNYIALYTNRLYNVTHNRRTRGDTRLSISSKDRSANRRGWRTANPMKLPVHIYSCEIANSAR